jgi:hypothetical protein
MQATEMAQEMLTTQAPIYMYRAPQFGGSRMLVSFAILAKGRCFSDLRLKVFCSKFVTKKQIKTARGLPPPKVLKNVTNNMYSA